MNIRTITLSGVTLLALTVSAAAQETGSMTGSAPSAAPEQPAPQPQYTPPPPPPPPPPPAAEYIPGGWYIGAGAGWSGQNAIKWQDPFGNSGEIHAHNNPIVFGSIGYKLSDMPFRAEIEGGYTWHGLYGFDADGANFPSSGHANLSHVMVNGLYDFPIAPLWAITVGGGVGVGMADYLLETPVSGSLTKDGFMWQGIAGLTYNVAPDVDLFAEYRYRDAQTGGSLPIGGDVLHVHGLTDNVAVAGFRWYVTP